jgi:ABC-type branched-subunit amino acid transport system ATPase component
MNILLKLEGVCKRFGGVVTADNVCMDVLPGEVHGLIGPNGAGKTTLLNLISGIYVVDSGSIWFNGKNITSIPPHERAKMGLSRTFQSPRFLARSSIRDNLMVGMDLANKFSYTQSFFGARGDDFNEQIGPLLEIAELSFDWDDEITSLPYGKQKLLEIIRALLSKPIVMLVDEPAAGLNQKEIEKAMALLNLAVLERNIGVVLIEHSMDMIMNISHNITVLNFGIVIGEGTPDEVSRNKEVIAAYLGSQNNAEN